MKNFIEIHHEGNPVLLNVSHICEVIEFDVPGDSGATIYMDYTDKTGAQVAIQSFLFG